MRRINQNPLGMNVNKKLATFLTGSLVLVASFLLLYACKPDDPKPTTETPEITAVSPLQGVPGATVTITGKNFKDGTDGVVVNFKTYPATVTSSSTTTIVCTVPEMPSGDATIVVSIDGTSSGAYTGFKVVEATNPATVTGFSPDNGSVGDEVVITGTNFGDDQSAVTVTINDMSQDIKAMTDSTITIELAPKTFSGEVVVTKSGVKYPAANEYNYEETYTVSNLIDIVPTDMAVDKEGNIYIANGEIIKYDSDGTEIKKVFNSTSKYGPTGLFLADNDTMYVSDYYGRILYVVPGEDEVKTLVAQGADTNIKVDYVEYITGDNAGNLYIAAGYYGLVTKYNMKNKSSEVIFTQPDSEATGTITYHNGRLYFTTDYGVTSIKTDGSDYQRPVKDFTNVLSQSGIVYYKPLDVFFLAGDDGNNIYKMDYDGTLTEAVTAEQAKGACNFMAIDNNGDLLVVSSSVKKVVIE